SNVFDYVQGRLQNNPTELDKGMSRKVGEYIYLIHRIGYFNNSQVDMLQWAYQILEENNQIELTEKIKTFASKFKYYEPDRKSLTFCMWVQKKDMDELRSNF
ncbi:MAG TPA: hypothetical protein VHM20_06475, partial [Gammaproteobacteria bacterium]|nr:hypothetical protein [Gammaproteobacteria bacterium]